ncbi:uncharacterized protein MEPE_05959 [Melanopsichium pennsylvanicum]|uniref:Uncharacterized protein n=2 Tax=Melanopsichium pennsylvanicum TaxID=63383 RepID=A0AAJ4XQE8_9BASI|nr:duf804 domain membrane protein [Melanopsichium pennsylvanicum 4]SNX87249.1 uncharacterized protein MEPE_05959 [Melanopsichium pennsylvanicum]
MLAISFSEDAHPRAPFSVATAIALGLIASFIQSLGLTIQRKSHLVNESLAPARRRTEWKRPLWLMGFVIFLVANIGGTIFQIGALPIVMLAPLGAVSLLYNAVLARFLLNDLLSKYMVMGTALIATGAILIGYFGVVPSPTHSLDELLDLYARPTFVAFATIFTFVFVGVLTVSHLTEWQLHTRLYRNSLPSRPQKPKHRSGYELRGRLRRRWSAPTLAPVVEVSESSSGIATPVLAGRDEAGREEAEPPSHSKRDYGSLGRSELNQRKRKKGIDVPRLELREAEQRIDAETVKQTKLGLAVAYGGASGTLSGACLLLAKSGVELLMLTFSGQNQFSRWQSWLLIGILLAAALLQLWYLNKALKLADPTLVCPLAFCFYNTSSIALGLVYFDQIGALAWYDLVLVVVGTAVLLGGVWTVSLHGNEDNCDGGAVCEEREPLLASPDRSRRATDADYEGLIAANAAGVAGPHLPPVSMSPHSSSFVDHNVAPLTSPEEATLTLHHDDPAYYPDSASSSARSTPQLGAASMTKRRFGSHGNTAQRRPTITLDFPLRDDLFSPKHDAFFSSQQDVESHAAVTASLTFHHTPEASDHDGSTAGKRKPSLYHTIIEHGLSIGISPSSPGFHLQPRSPSLSRATSSWQHHPGSRHPQRSMSEADAPSAVSGHRKTLRQGTRVDGGSEDSTHSIISGDSGQGTTEEINAGSSSFGMLLDQIDLSRRLDAVGIRKENERWWWSKFKPWQKTKRVESVVEEESDAGSVIVTSDSNGSLLAAPVDEQRPQGVGLGISASG